MIKRMGSLDGRTKSWIGLLLSLALFLGLGSFLLPHTPQQYPSYTTESPSPTGLKAFYSWMNDHLEHVGVWQKDTLSLPQSGNPQTMIVVESREPFNPEEEQYYIEWMERGHQLWLIQSHPRDFGIHVKSDPVGNIEELREITGYDQWAGEFKGIVGSEIRLEPDMNDRILLKDSYGPIAFARSYGDGELIVFITPEWFTNENIVKHNHLEMILPLLQDETTTTGALWFNEYVHGYGSQPPLLEAYPPWLLFAFAQLIIMTLLWLWYKGKRFGAVENPREWSVRFGDERIRAMAAWYERGGFLTESLKIQEEFIRFRIQERWGIPARLDANTLMDAARQRLSPRELSEWQELWIGLEQMKVKNKISHKEYIQRSKQLDQIRKELDNR
jgi:hypothetical protein